MQGFIASLVAAAGTFTLLGAPGYNDTINLGAILVAALVLIVGGLFTIRSNVATTWREAYEAEKVRAEQAEEEAKEQREMKHDLISELAAARMATDLTGHQKFMAELMTKLAEASSAALQERLSHLERNLLEGFKQQNKVLERIADRLDYSAEIVATDRSKKP